VFGEPEAEDAKATYWITAAPGAAFFSPWAKQIPLFSFTIRMSPMEPPAPQPTHWRHHCRTVSSNIAISMSTRLINIDRSSCYMHGDR
jgi:hypothetical protein